MMLALLQVRSDQRNGDTLPCVALSLASANATARNQDIIAMVCEDAKEIANYEKNNGSTALDIIRMARARTEDYFNRLEARILEKSKEKTKEKESIKKVAKTMAESNKTENLSFVDIQLSVTTEHLLTEITSL